MAERRLLTAERLREVLDYDPDTGVFRWRIQSSNRVLVGSVAGTSHKKGYVSIGVDGAHYLAHRLAWLYVHGAFPVDQIDHKDGDKANNSIRNLRPCTNSQNHANKPVRARDLPRGVTFAKERNRYIAQLWVNGRSIYLGRHKTPESAHAAYLEGARKHFGEFARAD